MKIFLCSASLALLVGIAALASAEAPAPSALLTSDPVYQKECAKCHGKSAEGRHLGGPSLVSEQAMKISTDDVRNILTNGKWRMPKYGSKLSAEEINRLVLEMKAISTKAP